MKTIMTDGARIFVEDWVIPYVTLDQLLAINGTQIAGKVFNAVSVGLGSKLLMITAYNAQTNGQTERYNKNLFSRLRY